MEESTKFPECHHQIDENENADGVKDAEPKHGSVVTVLERMLKLRPEEVVQQLVHPKLKFKEFLSKLPFPLEAIPSVVKLLWMASSSSLYQNNADVLHILTDSLSSELFLSHIPKYLTLVSFGRLKCRDMPGLLQSLIGLSGKLVERLPHAASERLSLVFLKCRDIVTRSEGEPGIDPAILQDIDTMEQLGEELLSKYNSPAVRRMKNKEEFLHAVPPPDHFRDVSVVLLASDIHQVFQPYLRPVITDGPYRDVEHYLDVLFRLMREDFVGPLRDGIFYFLALLSRGKLHELDYRQIQVYYEVRVVKETFDDQNGIINTVMFDVGKLRNVDWETTKRLQHGSLVCLSSDNFRTFYLATVKDRKKQEEPSKCMAMAIHFIGDFPLHFQAAFTMVESPTFYEAYYHVLLGLKALNEKNLPFQRYLVAAATDVGSPCYLSGKQTVYELLEGLTCQVLNYESWPTADHLGLDASQYSALKTALTKELAVIQGPPGTGKTYLGLKIMDILLRTRTRNMYDNGPFNVMDHLLLLKRGQTGYDKGMFIEDGDKPILVICFTNHALDQFLEGILRLKTPARIVRVGGRSKCSALEKCNLKELRRSVALSYQAKYEICHLSEFLSETGSLILSRNKIKEISKSRILNEECLHDFMISFHYFQFSMYARAASRRRRSGLEEWLLRGQKFNLRAEIGRTEMMSQEDLVCVSDVFALPIADRWKLYRFWLGQFQEENCRQIIWLRKRYENAAAQLQNSFKSRDVEILKGSHVVGMTTSGAARIRDVLQDVGPRIVIVEEAAEVMESHIITALTQQCEHLILIGDHQQLRPNPAVYKLAKDFHLDVSLFERLVLNGINCESLSLQHRMRPRIATLLIPHIYQNLKNHESVENYEHIRGVDHDVFFVDHRETESSVADSASHSNSFEGEYAVALCMYLLNQGYEPSQITILTTYVGQLLLLKRLMHSSGVDGAIHCTTVDNYQGEENDVVILSLVRSNPDGKVGFLRIDNRVCVALSRARMGLFAIGNFAFLTENSKIWKPIVENLTKDDSVGRALTLRCQNHPQTVIEAARAEDFKKAPEGGCGLPCKHTLQCGHQCTRLCHGYDKTHEAFQCQQHCERIFPCRHPCQRKCHEVCGSCKWLVPKTIPKCGHEQQVPCRRDPAEFICQMPCGKILPCQHPCARVCGKLCRPRDCSVQVETLLPCGHPFSGNCKDKGAPCLVQVSKVLPCTHTFETSCSQDLRDHVCMVGIEKTLACGHAFVARCSEWTTGLAEVTCEVEVEKTLGCGHQCWTLCGTETRYVKCNIPVEKVLRCGHSMSVKCVDSKQLDLFCSANVERQLPCGHQSTTPCGINPDKCVCVREVEAALGCGHQAMVPCCRSKDPKFLQLVAHPCPVALPCGHKWSGTCGALLHGAIHVRCPEKCSQTLVCGHLCQGMCADGCGSCGETCANRCPHSKCNGRCGMPCTPCRLPCSWQCEHYKCTRKCFDVCDRPTCQEPCPLKLKCDHPCIGFCGEPCPKLCRICDKDNTLLVKHPDGDSVLFVLLEDCGHVIEADQLDGWIRKQLNKARWRDGCCIMIKCPVCKTVVRHNFRYGNVIKRAIIDTSMVKLKLFRNEMSLQKTRKPKMDQPDGNGNREAAEKTFTQLMASRVLQCKPKVKACLQSNVSVLRNWYDDGPKSTMEWFFFFREILRQQYVVQVIELLNRETTSSLEKIAATLFKCSTFNPVLEKVVKKLLASFVHVNGIEQPAGLKQLKINVEPDASSAHWFKCPNGHYYFFHALNRAAEKRVCAECKGGIKPSTQDAVANLFDQEFQILQRELQVRSHREDDENLSSFQAFREEIDSPFDIVAAEHGQPISPQNAFDVAAAEHRQSISLQNVFDVAAAKHRQPISLQSAKQRHPPQARAQTFRQPRSGGSGRERVLGQIKQSRADQDTNWRSRSDSTDRQPSQHNRERASRSASCEPLAGRRHYMQQQFSTSAVAAGLTDTKQPSRGGLGSLAHGRPFRRGNPHDKPHSPTTH